MSQLCAPTSNKSNKIAIKLNFVDITSSNNSQAKDFNFFNSNIQEQWEKNRIKYQNQNIQIENSNPQLSQDQKPMQKMTSLCQEHKSKILYRCEDENCIEKNKIGCYKCMNAYHHLHKSSFIEEYFKSDNEQFNIQEQLNSYKKLNLQQKINQISEYNLQEQFNLQSQMTSNELNIQKQMENIDQFDNQKQMEQVRQQFMRFQNYIKLPLQIEQTNEQRERLNNQNSSELQFVLSKQNASQKAHQSLIQTYNSINKQQNWQSNTSINLTETQNIKKSLNYTQQPNHQNLQLCNSNQVFIGQANPNQIYQSQTQIQQYSGQGQITQPSNVNHQQQQQMKYFNEQYSQNNIIDLNQNCIQYQNLEQMCLQNPYVLLQQNKFQNQKQNLNLTNNFNQFPMLSSQKPQLYNEISISSHQQLQNQFFVPEQNNQFEKYQILLAQQLNTEPLVQKETYDIYTEKQKTCEQQQLEAQLKQQQLQKQQKLLKQDSYQQFLICQQFNNLSNFNINSKNLVTNYSVNQQHEQSIINSNQLIQNQIKNQINNQKESIVNENISLQKNQVKQEDIDINQNNNQPFWQINTPNTFALPNNEQNEYREQIKITNTQQFNMIDQQPIASCVNEKIQNIQQLSDIVKYENIPNLQNSSNINLCNKIPLSYGQQSYNSGNKKINVQYFIENKCMKSQYTSLDKVIHEHLENYPQIAMLNAERMIQISLNTFEMKYYLNLVDIKSKKILMRREIGPIFQSLKKTLSFDENKRIVLYKINNNISAVYERDQDFVEFISNSTLKVIKRLREYSIQKILSYNMGRALAIASLSGKITLFNINNDKFKIINQFNVKNVKPKYLHKSAFSSHNDQNNQNLNFDANNNHSQQEQEQQQQFNQSFQFLLNCDIFIQNNQLFWCGSSLFTFTYCMFEISCSVKMLINPTQATYPNGILNDDTNKIQISNVQVFNNRVYFEFNSIDKRSDHFLSSMNSINILQFGKYNVLQYKLKDEKGEKCLTLYSTHPDTNLIKTSNPLRQVFLYNTQKSHIIGITLLNKRQPQLQKKQNELKQDDSMKYVINPQITNKNHFKNFQEIKFKMNVSLLQNSQIFYFYLTFSKENQQQNKNQQFITLIDNKKVFHKVFLSQSYYTTKLS